MFQKKIQPMVLMLSLADIIVISLVLYTLMTKDTIGLSHNQLKIMLGHMCFVVTKIISCDNGTKRITVC